MPLKDREAYNRYQAEYQLRRYHRRREEALILLGGKCVRCGAAVDLQFDHSDRNSKELDIARLWSVSYKRFLAEIVKCQLLCFSCHIKKTVESKDFLPRGSVTQRQSK